MPKKGEKKSKEAAVVPAPQTVAREITITDHWPSETIAVMRQQFGKDLTDSEFKMFLMQAHHLGADPVRKEIYASVYTDKNGNRTLTLISSIDYLRRVATSHPRYNGTSDAEFGPIVEVEFGEDQYKRKVKVPEWAKISIWLKDAEHPVEATAYFEEYLPGQKSKQFMWGKMPRTMIAKCAEALAIRKAFPKELGQVYTEEEKDGMKSHVVSVDKAGEELVNSLKELIAKKGVEMGKVLRKFTIESIEDIDVKRGRLLFQTLQAMADKIEPKDAEVEPSKVKDEEIPVIEPKKK